jgi:hyperosmotically inducible periplasmic protein
MRHRLGALLVLVMLVAVTAGCTAMTGKSAGQNVDDATITAQVKTKLAAEKPATLTKVDVDTNQGTVYLTGNVENATVKARATELARQVAGVRDVVNNLKIQIP